MIVSIIILIGCLLNIMIVGMTTLNAIYMSFAVVLIVISIPSIKIFLVNLLHKNKWLNSHNYIYLALIIILIGASIVNNPYKEEHAYFEKLELANSYLEKEKHNKVVKICEDLLEDDVEDVNALLLLGMSYLKEEDYDSSYTYLKNAYELEPYNISVIHNLALNRYRKGEYWDDLSYNKDAIKYYKELNKLQPRLINPYIYISELSMDLKLFGQAKLYLQYAKIMEPDNRYVLWLLANYHMDMMENYEAIKVIEEALDMNLDKKMENEFEDLLDDIESTLEGDV